jgi:hypothetical protein
MTTTPTLPTTADLTGAACVGQHTLFDSVLPADHMEAAELCAGCPAIEACRGLLREASQIAYGGGKGGFLQGTWAGQLYGRPGFSRPQIEEMACL